MLPNHFFSRLILTLAILLTMSGWPTAAGTSVMLPVLVSGSETTAGNHDDESDGSGIAAENDDDEIDGSDTTAGNRDDESDDSDKASDIEITGEDADRTITVIVRSGDEAVKSAKVRLEIVKTPEQGQKTQSKLTDEQGVVSFVLPSGAEAWLYTTHASYRPDKKKIDTATDPDEIPFYLEARHPPPEDTESDD